MRKTRFCRTAIVALVIAIQGLDALRQRTIIWFRSAGK
jgi:hypothetical protein